ncbi:LacI family transcriptional regulator [Spirochaetia bacterium]|nr:LacI family transcriptional regulator [Spirochaetia bacterium]GHV71920.1 LacI family transcriptional regulator [Spirochaetia bacterium]
MPTIKDVAGKAGVSIATVSRVFNNRGYLSDEVKQKVASAMEELDYHPNDLARSLQNRRSWIIGLIVPSVAHPFFGAVARYVEKFAYQSGYKVLLCNSLHESEKERDYIKMLRRSQVDGIIMGSHVMDTANYADLHLPVISLDRELSPDIPYVCCDNYQGGELAARHLISKGCRNIVHISGSLSVPMLSNKRTDAFIAVCKEAGAVFHCYELPDKSLVDFDNITEFPHIFEDHPECDGVFTTSDITAAAIISLAVKAGRRVPDDLKVIGFDGILPVSLFSPTLTSIRQPIEAISRYALEYLVRLIDGEPVPSKTVLPVTFLDRESAG